MILRRGDTGKAVRKLQRNLGFTGDDVDGLFGPATQRSVRSFQKSRELLVDGVVGRNTWGALMAQQEVPAKSQASQEANLRAFLDTIAHAEGTDRYGNNDGYDVIVGGELLSDFSDHPNKRVWLPAYGIHSTAAGRYQILHRFWRHYKAQLGLPDFSQDSQDRYAVQQIRERRAYDDVLNGRIADAIRKCANIWASFPGAGYGQREVAVQDLLDFYQQRGGVLS
ncbi:peptidoglycan-binding protein [Vreelandella alkaliphila]|uniref:peptidoglycan-binding protein n=1 Tax=Vreelandella alkaliphila TaxID=272774 RepID=UPI003FD7E4D2